MSSDSCVHESPDVVLSRVADYIRQNDVKRIVVLAGAGISTASGIPDFRTPGSGLYDNLARYNLPWPEAVFDLDYFHSNPKPFYELAKELYPSGRYRPNVVHYFIRLLHEQSRLLRVYTQNIDSLERIAGIPEEKLVEAHGTFLKAHCTVCREKAPTNLVKDAIDRGVVAKCTKCGNLVKPDIVFFGENLPDSFWKHKSDLMQTDFVFVMGTSLEVHPFAGVADIVSKHVPRVLFNRDLVGTFRFGLRPLDMAVLGEMTQTVRKLTTLLNWNSELERLMEKCERNSKTKSDTQTGKSNNAKKPISSIPDRRYSTSTSPVLPAIRRKSLSIPPTPDQLKPLWSARGSSERATPSQSRSQSYSFRQIRKGPVTPSQASVPNPAISHPVRSLTRDPLPIVKHRHQTAAPPWEMIPHLAGSVRPQPRDTLTALRAYLYCSSAHTSDSESTDSGHSFLNCSLDSVTSDTHCDTKWSSTFTD